MASSIFGVVSQESRQFNRQVRSTMSKCKNLQIWCKLRISSIILITILQDHKMSTT